MAESAGDCCAALKNCFVCVQKMALDENILQKVQETAVHVLKGCFTCC